MSGIILKMQDGGIVDVIQDNSYYSGCETCDYGSQYTNELDVILTKHKIKAEINQMYEYVLDDGQLMKIFLCNIEEIKEMTEMQFIEWFKQKLENENGNLEYKVWNIE